MDNISNLLKTKFEDCKLWLRFAISLSLDPKSAHSALQAFKECSRIDQNSPLPAMLAAKLVLKNLDDPELGLGLVSEAIDRCQKLEGKSVDPILSKCYLLASIMHAHIYEREPESIKQFKTSNFSASLHYLDLAGKTFPDDYLVYFHKALHDVRQKSYSTAIDNIRQAIKLNPHHVPSMQILILSLSALKNYDEALVLCDMNLHEFEDDLLLLYIKCNLEQCLVETKGYKAALNTARYILKRLQKYKPKEPSSQVVKAAPSLDLAGTVATMEQSPTETRQSNLFANDAYQNDRQLGWSMSELSAWLLVAEIFIKLGSLHDAELCVNEGAAHASGSLSYQIFYTRGLIAQARNNLGEAKSFFQSCLALNPKHPHALQQMGHVHYSIGNFSVAEKFLRDSLDVDNDCQKTWSYLGLVYIETNQHEKAKECVRKASVLEDCSPVISISAISRLTLE